VNAITAIAPGKLILSGEHAVVYHKAALATAINRYARCTIQANTKQELQLHGDTLKIKQHYTEKQRQAIYIKGQQKPTGPHDQPSAGDVLVFCIEHFYHHYPLPNKNIIVTLETDIPLGHGLGSSAAIIISTLYALHHWHHITPCETTLLSLAKDSEDLIHGISSGIDLFTAYHGGTVLYQQGCKQHLDIPLPPLTLINTGQAQSSTGDCVQQVKQQYANDHALWDRFAQTTQDFIQALQQQQALGPILQANQTLLNHIGVTPASIQDFITHLQRHGASAKLCGAGAITGDNAGMLLVDSTNDLSALCKPYPFTPFTVSGHAHGARLL
jgi:mevalonate kinase